MDIQEDFGKRKELSQLVVKHNRLIQKALVTLTKDERLKKFGTTKMIDSTTVSMCLTFFDWAESSYFTNEYIIVFSFL